MNADRLPWLFVIISVGGATASLWVSSYYGLIPDCRVFLDGCTSISSVGRNPPAAYVFRATVLPSAALLPFIWLLAAVWLMQVGAASYRWAATVAILGGLSPMLLITYITLLGAPGELADILRQRVVTTYFPVALIAKLIIGVLLVRQTRTRATVVSPWLSYGMLIVAAVVLLVAILSAIVDQLMADPSRVHHSMQWPATVVFALWYLLLALAWRQTGFILRAESASTAVTCAGHAGEHVGERTDRLPQAQ